MRALEQALLRRDMRNARVPDEGPVAKDPLSRSGVDVVHRHNLNGI
jgi:hypothetical protein